MSEMLLVPVGIDVSKLTLDIAVRLANKLRKQHVANSPQGFVQLSTWLSKLGVSQAHICVEATGTYSDAIALWGHEHGHQVSVLNPARVAAFRKAEGHLSKTDAQDAALLVRYCEQKRPAAWTPTPAEVLKLQGLVQRLDDLEQMRQQERNRLENSRWSPEVREQIEESIARLDEQIKQIKQWLKEHLKESDELKKVVDHLDSIVGVGHLSAARLVSGLREITRFERVEQVVSFAGLDPCEHQSGSSVHAETSISKNGSAQFRKWLYMCALVSKRWDPDMKQWANELQAKGKAKKHVIVAVMRKLLHIVYGVWKSGTDYDPKRTFPSHYLVVSQGAAPSCSVRGSLADQIIVRG